MLNDKDSSIRDLYYKLESNIITFKEKFKDLSDSYDELNKNHELLKLN